MARVSIIGTGYVGLCTGVVFAHHGHDVVMVDVMPEKLDAVRHGRAPFYEPGVDEALTQARRAGHLDATDDLARAVHETDLTFLCVGTPQGKDGAIDLAQIRGAARAVGQAIAKKRRRHTVVVKSTVVPGTLEDVVVAEVAAGSRLRPGMDFGAASNPEFLKEGAAMKDAFEPDRIVVGALDEPSAAAVWQLYERFSCPKITTNPRTAEMIKYAANGFLATKIAFSNEMANVCERIGVDWVQVADGIGHDRRIGSLFLRAGVGFGGSCFPKDLAALNHVAKSVKRPSGILDAALRNNDLQPTVAVSLLQEELGSLKGKRIALMGVAFKADTDDVRETRALPLLRALEAAGARVVVHDPRAAKNFLKLAPRAHVAERVEDALGGADAAVFQTEWEEYRRLPLSLLKGLLKQPVVVDGRRTFDARAMRDAGIRYRAIGLGQPLDKRIRAATSARGAANGKRRPKPRPTTRRTR